MPYILQVLQRGAHWRWEDLIYERSGRYSSRYSGERISLNESVNKNWRQISWQCWFIHYGSNRIPLEVFHFQACSAPVLNRAQVNIYTKLYSMKPGYQPKPGSYKFKGNFVFSSFNLSLTFRTSLLQNIFEIWSERRKFILGEKLEIKNTHTLCYWLHVIIIWLVFVADITRALIG